MYNERAFFHNFQFNRNTPLAFIFLSSRNTILCSMNNALSDMRESTSFVTRYVVSKIAELQLPDIFLEMISTIAFISKQICYN